jgi:pyruvate dehydrogenase E2 component (dihydrolipoamide acetyltransferase)
MTDILMPALSPTMEEGTLAKWNVKEGDTVSSGDVIAEIETDKATMEVEAVDEGVVDAILVPAGTEGVKVNTPIATLRGEGENAGASPAAAQSQQSLPERQKPAQTNGSAIPGASSSDARAPRDERRQEVEQAQGAAPQAAPPAASKPASVANGSGQRVFASPLARRLAQQKGVELSSLRGSGPHGRVIAADIDKAQPGAARPQAQAGAAPPSAPPAQVRSLEQMGIQPGSYELIPLDNIRRVSARRLTEAFRDIPHFPLSIDCEIDALLEARSRINALLESSGVKVSVNDIVIKAAAMALKKVPEANASFTPEGIALHKHADIAMAVAIPGGLITPVIRQAETKSLSQISTEAKDLAKRARDKKLKPEEFQGGTFSVSNLGMFGVKSFSSIINEPGGCIMSVGAGIQQPVVKKGQIAIATVMNVTLTCDHRVVDGATGARFLQAFKPLVEDPVAMLA